MKNRYENMNKTIRRFVCVLLSDKLHNLMSHEEGFYSSSGPSQISYKQEMGLATQDFAKPGQIS